MADGLLIPELRFPDFKNVWAEIKLGDSFRNARDKGNDNLPIYSVSQELGLVPRSSLDRSIQNDAKSDSNLYVKEKDLVYNMMRMWQGALGIATNECMVSPAYVVLRPKKGHDSKFYLYLFSRERSLYLLWAYSYGLTDDRLRLYFKDFAKIKIAVPTYDEQQKIASFFTSVDKRVQILQEKKVQLERYKKGVMQKLFSQEIRFKDENDNDFPEWENKKLEEVFTSIKGTGLSKDKLDEKGIFECILYGELYTTYAEVIDFVNSKTNVEEGVLSKKGDLLVPCSTTTSAIDLANVTALNKDNVRLGGDITILRSLKPISNIFYAYYLSNFKNHDIAKYGQGSTIVHLYYNHFKRLEIKLPSLEEQNKISSFLTSLDNIISSLRLELEKSIDFKKGLLQKMFV